MGQRLTGMTAFQKSLPLAGSHVRVRAARPVAARGSASCCRTPPGSSTSCASSSRCTPRRSTTIRRSRSSRPDRSRPAGRRWARGSSYGLGSENENLPAFVVLISRAREGDQPLYSWLWGSGFLPSQHQGVQFRARQGSGALPERSGRASTATSRRRMLDTLRALEQQQHARVHAIPRSTRASRSTRWPTACRRRCRT